MAEGFRTVVLNENYAEAATTTLSGGSYSGSLPITLLQDRDTNALARTTNALTTSTIIKADLGSAQIIGGIAVCNGNWSLDSTYRIEISNDSGFSSLLYDSGWVEFPGFTVDPSELDPSDPDYGDGVLRNTLLPEFPLNLVHVLESDITGRYVRISFDDTANVDTYLEYGYLFIGRAFRPSINYSEDNGYTPAADVNDVFESLGLTRVYSEYGSKRMWQARFPSLATGELFGSLTRMLVKSRTSRPVFVVIDPTATLHMQSLSFLATMQKAPAIQQLLVERGTTAFEFREL